MDAVANAKKANVMVPTVSRVSIVCSTGFDFDARVIRSVRALSDAGFDVDPILISSRAFSSGQRRSSVGIRYTEIGPLKVSFVGGLRQGRPPFRRAIRQLLRRLSDRGVAAPSAALLLLLLTLAVVFRSVFFFILASILFVVSLLLQTKLIFSIIDKIQRLLPARLSRLELHRDIDVGQQLIVHLRKTRPHLIVLHDIIPLLYASEIRANFASNIVWDAHELYTDVPGLRGASRDACHEFLLRSQQQLDGLVVVNPLIEEIYRERYPALPPSISITNACRTPKSVPYDGRLHSAAGVSEGKRILLYQGGLGTHRGLDLLSELALFLSQEWVLVFMGHGEMQADLERRAQRRSFVVREDPHTVVVEPAPFDELPLWTSGASLATIFYEPTCLNSELASPNKIWEYAGAGVPLLARDLPFIRSKVNEYDSGWLVPISAKASDIADFINNLSADDLLRKALNARTMSQAEDGRIEDMKLVAYLRGVLHE